jgi:D-alanyl-D-alanine carboxypeptidase
MKRTVYSNSHGLPNALNKSCASDLAILISYALKNDIFRTIISCKSYGGSVVRHLPEGFSQTRTFLW